MVNFRGAVFWLLQNIKQDDIVKHYYDLKKVDADTFNREELREVQNSRLKSLLFHALNTTEFYKGSVNNAKIEDFPVINKQTIRSNFSKFISSSFDQNELKEVVTSGSTGLPFKVLQDQYKIKRNTADTIFFGGKANFKVGDPLVYIKIWNEINQKTKLKEVLQNIVPINVFNLSDENIYSFLDSLNKKRQPLVIISYSSAIERIASFVKNHPSKLKLKFSVKSIITVSEALSDEARKIIKEVFGCSVFSRYSNMENGIIAQESFDLDQGFLINSSSYLVEVLDLNSNKPLEEGETGRIVVTDFYNFGMPIIRYDTGDIGTKGFIETPSGAREVLTNVEGRRMDSIYNTKGELVSSFIITNEMWKFSELLQYQFIQKSFNDYEFKLNVEGNFEREDELIEHFKKFLGEDACISISYVNEIPLLSSGKRKKVLNRMNS